MIKEISTLDELKWCRDIAERNDWPHADLLDFATRVRSKVFVIFDGNQAVGYACTELYYNVNDPSHSEPTTWAALNDILIDASYQGQGYGSRLLKRVEEYAVNNSAVGIRLHAEQDDVDLINFYQAREYKIVCLLHSYYAELGQHAYYMEKAL